jgi:cobaltochelatase CobT
MRDAAEALARLAVPIIVVALLLVLAFWRPRKHPVPVQVSDGPENEPYRVYTREFDLILPWADAISSLDSASPDAEQSNLGGANLLQANALRLQANALRRADTELDEQRAAGASERGEWVEKMRSAAHGIDPGDFAVALLIDQSGSMKGRPIAFAATAAALLVDLIAEFGGRSEVLGFSTAGWRGGYARQKWLEAGQPARPGRLCSLRHVIFKSAEEQALTDAARRAMAHADLLRENLDGEAILWAEERLAALPERHKILIVVSDGAPVDDSTLMHNGPSYLYRHVKTVLAAIEEARELTMGGLGINHRVEAFYPISEMVETPEELPGAGTRVLERLIAAAAHKAEPKA